MIRPQIAIQDFDPGIGADQLEQGDISRFSEFAIRRQCNPILLASQQKRQDPQLMREGLGDLKTPQKTLLILKLRRAKLQHTAVLLDGTLQALIEPALGLGLDVDRDGHINTNPRGELLDDLVDDLRKVELRLDRIEFDTAVELGLGRDAVEHGDARQDVEFQRSAH